jgi:hypothetical protein
VARRECYPIRRLATTNFAVSGAEDFRKDNSEALQQVAEVADELLSCSP